MFTDRFIKVPIKIYDINEKLITGKETCVDSFMKFNPFDICEYRRSYSEDTPEIEVTSIALRNGTNILVEMHISEFEALINRHFAANNR